MTPSFGDRVRVRHTPETEAAGLAGKTGVVSGETTPSQMRIEVHGTLNGDHAMAVMFEEEPTSHAWFAPELLEFVDHAPGTMMQVGNVRAVRQPDGTWLETTVDGKPLGNRPWWKFW